MKNDQSQKWLTESKNKAYNKITTEKYSSEQAQKQVATLKNPRPKAITANIAFIICKLLKQTNPIWLYNVIAKESKATSRRM